MKVLRPISTVLLALTMAGCGGSAAAPTASPAAASAAPSVPTPTVPPTTPPATPAPTATASAPAVAAHIEVDGLTRDYLVVTPPDVADRDPMPLLLVLHGAGETMCDARILPRLRHDGPRSRRGCRVSAGHETCVPRQIHRLERRRHRHGRSQGDVAFIKALIDRMKADYPIDPNRVFIIGASNGGQMAYLAACELSSHVAAVADVIGAMLVPCHPSQPVSVIAIHGDADEIIPIDGGKVEYCPPLLECPPFAGTMDSWRQIDGCIGDPTVTESAKTVETSWADCEDGTAVTFIKVNGKGHTWYTSDPDDRAVTWDFFMNHPRSAGTS